MSARRALGCCTVALALAAAGPAPAAAQTPPPPPPAPAAAQTTQPLAERSLLTTDVRDERAVWVNPAGLARHLAASLAGDLTVAREGGDARLAQYGVTLSSRSLAFGWEHDRHPDGTAADTYVLGLGLGTDRYSGGVARRWHRGGEGSWDVALRGRATETVDLSLVWRDIGSPVVRGVVLRDRFVPAAGLRLLGERLLAGVEADVPGDLGRLTAVRAGAGIALLPGLVVSGRATFSRDAARRDVAVLIGVGARSWRGALAALVTEAGGLGALGGSGAVVADLTGGPTRR